MMAVGVGERTRTRLAVYAAVTLFGILLSIMSDSTLGGIVTIGALVMLIWTLHKFGRSGPD